MPDNSTSINQPSKITGQYHSMKGTVVEAIGDVTGATSWQQSGRQEHIAGETEVQTAQAKEYVEGAIDSAKGKIGSVVDATTGDRAEPASSR